MSQKFILIGGAGGIGSALSQMLAADGAELFLGGRDEEKLRVIASETDAGYSTLDATQPSEVDAFFACAQEHLGRIDGAVNLAGSILLKPAHQTTDAEWQQVLATNLTTAFSTVRAATRAMMGQSPGGGSVVLVSTVAASFGLPAHEAIAAAKAGVQGLTLSAAATYARHPPRGHPPRQLRRARLGRHAARQRNHRQRDDAQSFGRDAPAGAHWHARSGRERDSLPLAAAKRLGDRPDSGRRRRPGIAARPLKSSAQVLARRFVLKCIS
jgi:hypothetical protein